MIKLKDIIGVIKYGLENLDTFSEQNRKVRVRNLYIINEDSLCCEFYSYSRNSTDIKLEIAAIMGFFNGFFRNNGVGEIKFASYTAKAFDENDVELTYAISSKSTAELIGTGNSIDWLKSTFFQENTYDYRLAQAKRIISEIENCLRELVKTKLKKEFGNDWWNKSLDNKLGKEVKHTYVNQFGIECNKGDILISYTYTLQLKKIISTHFNLFKSYFDNLVKFNDQMDSLNKIRREEAHNRNITKNNLIDLENLHERLTAKALLELTTFQSGYLTENWRLKIKRILVEKTHKSIHDQQKVLNEKDLLIKLLKVKENIQHLISYLDDTIMKLKSISTPPHKKATQRELVNVLEKYRDLQSELLHTSAKLNEKEVKSTIIKIDEHERDMNKFLETFLLHES